MFDNLGVIKYLWSKDDPHSSKQTQKNHFLCLYICVGMLRYEKDLFGTRNERFEAYDSTLCVCGS